MNIIGPQLRAYRNKHKLTLDQFSNELNLCGIDISKAVLSKIENCERKITDIQVLQFAKCLSLSLDELYGQEHTQDLIHLHMKKVVI